GGAGATPMVGDWDGDGLWTVGVFEPSAMWKLRNSNSAGAPDGGQFAYGSAGWKPIPADWDGNGVSTVGVFNPLGQFNEKPATWHQRNKLALDTVTVGFTATG